MNVKVKESYGYQILTSGLYALKQSRSILNGHGKTMLPYALIYSHLKYRITVWYGQLNARDKKNQVIQNKCIGQITHKI